jgi:hypothetical protein
VGAVARDPGGVRFRAGGWRPPSRGRDDRADPAVCGRTCVSVCRWLCFVRQGRDRQTASCWRSAVLAARRVACPGKSRQPPPRGSAHACAYDRACSHPGRASRPPGDATTPTCGWIAGRSGVAGKNLGRRAAPPSGLQTPDNPGGVPIEVFDGLLGTEDKVIPADRQRFMARRAGARIMEVEAGHLSLVSRPVAVTDLIVKAAHQTTSTA